MLGPRDSAYAVNLTYDRHTDILYISPEISIEHPSVGLASLAQLLTTANVRKYELIAKVWFKFFFHKHNIHHCNGGLTVHIIP